jgi:predicted nucleotidyltransferase
MLCRKQEVNMFTAEQRDHVRQRVLELARTDPRVTAGALTGSMALGSGDEWSDIDVAFGITDSIALETVLHDWTQVLDQEFGVLDHFDLPSGSSIYRVFLLPGGLEVDVAVTPGEDFGARGPNFRALFGTIQKLQATPPPDASYLIGLCWHHVLHARSCIERHKPWQAEYWISAIRDHILALACIRLGENPVYGRGVDRLPATVTSPLADALVRSLDEPELRRALAVATRCLIGELEQWDPTLCTRLKPLLLEFGASQAEARQQRSSNVLAEQ